MPGPDATAAAALGAPVLREAVLGFLDFAGDPLRATSWPADIVPSGTGDADLDGFTFSSVATKMISVSPVRHQEKGSDTVSFRLSGIVGPNSDLLNLMADESKWRGRVARLWLGVFNENYAQQGGFFGLYTGRMVRWSLAGAPDMQQVVIEAENYLEALFEPSNRTYLDQALYDAGDATAAAARGIGVGVTTGSPYNPGRAGGAGGGGIGERYFDE